MEKRTQLEVSKWVSHFALLSTLDLETFLNTYTPHLAHTGRILKNSDPLLDAPTYLKTYNSYLTSFEKLPELNCALTADKEALEMRDLSEERFLITPIAPIIVVKTCSFSYSKENKKFLTEVFGNGGTSFGLHFAFPQLYRDPKDRLIKKPHHDPHNKNAKLFRNLRHFVREKTAPATFLMEGEKCISPLRISRNFSQENLPKGITLVP
jgi:hypothetical protein